MPEFVSHTSIRYVDKEMLKRLNRVKRHLDPAASPYLARSRWPTYNVALAYLR